MTTHTPGPWTLVRGNDPELQSEDYPGPLVCTPADNGFTQADARLIAAAPDLLAALRGVVKHLYDEDDRRVVPWGVCQAIFAAITKAEGK